jgi:hypothetical protein
MVHFWLNKLLNTRPCTYIKIVRHSDDREEPEDAIEPANIAVKPARVIVDERLQKQVKRIY